MSTSFEQLQTLGYCDCFYHEGQLWGFYNNDVMPHPIPQDVLQMIDLETPRKRLMGRAQRWCDRRGINALQRTLSR